MNESVRDLPEILLSCFSVIDSNCERDFVRISRQLAEVDFNLFVIAVSCASEVIAHVLNCAG